MLTNGLAAGTRLHARDMQTPTPTTVAYHIASFRTYAIPSYYADLHVIFGGARLYFAMLTDNIACSGHPAHRGGQLQGVSTLTGARGGAKSSQCAPERRPSEPVLAAGARSFVRRADASPTSSLFLPRV